MAIWTTSLVKGFSRRISSAETRREHQRGTGGQDRNRRHGFENDQAGEQREANGHPPQSAIGRACHRSARGVATKPYRSARDRQSGTRASESRSAKKKRNTEDGNRERQKQAIWRYSTLAEAGCSTRAFPGGPLPCERSGAHERTCADVSGKGRLAQNSRESLHARILDRRATGAALCRPQFLEALLRPQQSLEYRTPSPRATAMLTPQRDWARVTAAPLIQLEQAAIVEPADKRQRRPARRRPVAEGLGGHRIGASENQSQPRADAVAPTEREHGINEQRQIASRVEISHVEHKGSRVTARLGEKVRVDAAARRRCMRDRPDRSTQSLLVKHRIGRDSVRHARQRHDGSRGEPDRFAIASRAFCRRRRRESSTRDVEHPQGSRVAPARERCRIARLSPRAEVRSVANRRSSGASHAGAVTVPSGLTPSAASTPRATTLDGGVDAMNRSGRDYECSGASPAADAVRARPSNAIRT